MFKNSSLFLKTFLLISSGLAVTMLLFSYISIINQEKALLDVVNSKTNIIAKSIALVSSDAMVTEDYSFIVQHNEKVLEDNKDIHYIVVTKKNSKTNIINNQSGWTMTKELPNSLTDIQTKKMTAKILKSELLKGQEVYHLSYPIIFSGIEWGWVSIGYSLNEYNINMDKAYLFSLFLLIGTLLLSFVFTYYLTKWLVEPIILFNNAAQQVSSGNLNTQVNIATNDELGELSKSFNNMVKTIKNSNEELHSLNEDLEKRVNLRTQELSELNISLDKRVKDEVNKRAEQEQILIQQSRFAAMGEMIGNIAHQWRQPLNALSLVLQNIENAYEMDILDAAYIKRSVEKGNRLTSTMSQTIDDFRNFFKPNKEATVFSVASSIEGTLEMILASFENHSIDIHKNLDEKLCTRGFASEFSQVILNILNNSKDAIIEDNPEKKDIYIDVYSLDKKIYIEIKDSAKGIPQEIINNIFDPYFTTKEEGKGTGIGLYMSKMIIQNNMKGKISVENTQSGAKFRIIIKAEACNEKNQ